MTIFKPKNFLLLSQKNVCGAKKNFYACSTEKNVFARIVNIKFKFYFPTQKKIPQGKTRWMWTVSDKVYFTSITLKIILMIMVKLRCLFVQFKKISSENFPNAHYAHAHE